MEVGLLDEAGLALREGRAAQALALFDEHASRFPNGVLAEERAAGRVFSLCKLGRVGEARREADTFLRDRPRSPLTERVRASCGGYP
jgi:outer membrane protein assembly factor BamD (BamD/ComL family)